MDTRCVICSRIRSHIQISVYQKQFICQTCQGAYYNIFKDLYESIKSAVENRPSQRNFVNVARIATYKFLDNPKWCFNNRKMTDYAKFCSISLSPDLKITSKPCKKCRFRVTILIFPLQPPKFNKSKGRVTEASKNYAEIWMSLKTVWLDIVKFVAERVRNLPDKIKAGLSVSDLSIEKPESKNLFNIKKIGTTHSDEKKLHNHDNPPLKQETSKKTSQLISKSSIMIYPSHPLNHIDKVLTVLQFNDFFDGIFVHKIDLKATKMRSIIHKNKKNMRFEIEAPHQTNTQVNIELGHRGGIHRMGATSTAL